MSNFGVFGVNAGRIYTKTTVDKNIFSRDFHFKNSRIIYFYHRKQAHTSLNIFFDENKHSKTYAFESASFRSMHFKAFSHL